MSCRTKRRYITADQAIQVLAEVAVRRGDTTLEPYQCRACGLYHLGRPTRADRHLPNPVRDQAIQVLAEQLTREGETA